MKILVIGAGPAGTRCATRIAARDPAAEVTLCGAEGGKRFACDTELVVSLLLLLRIGVAFEG